ncbi:DUF6220 domain-containing protein [Actinoplanes sp. NPDC049548]|uniref:DUF6220 domain-containing protein n=1 Tax=Actinoplanes sp. NPDC049548 TaxID=3155152 RepID=UPI003446D018
MRSAFAGLAASVMLAIVVQFFLAAGAAFDPAPTEEAFGPHRTLGMGTVALALVLTVVGAAARMPGRLVGLSALVTGLGILQPVIAVAAGALGGTTGRLVFGLHAINGLVMAATARTVVREARRPAPVS